MSMLELRNSWVDVIRKQKCVAPVLGFLTKIFPKVRNILDNTRVYPHYINKAEKKGRTKEEVDEIIFWLTGYNVKSLNKLVDDETDFENFFTKSPQINPNVSKIKGVICGYRAEEIEDKLMQQIAIWIN